ncbi:MAG: deoxyribodipyrimidine photo-lyase [Candidatus Gracilibacteria bacterium]|nr:deoxyribodipyrimidine photo-lyase [Candidatus Gracilibacteria bacterium]MCP4524091.1 deoxyribodipyrimidine photo-lyase [Candidatus Gracilibacteria bacterium]
MYKKTIFWFRQDLRTFDNIGLYNAVLESENIIPIFILDENIQQRFGRDDQRFLFIYELLRDLKKELNQKGSDLFLFEGKPEIILEYIIDTYKINAIFTNTSYSNYGTKRDKKIKKICCEHKITFKSFTDYLILPPEKIEYRKVFTPFYKKWRPVVDNLRIELKNIHTIFTHFSSENCIEIPDGTHPYFTIDTVKSSLLHFDFKNYEKNKDFPSQLYGTSQLSPFLRFGKISVRWLFQKVENVNEAFIKELAWREFWHHVRYNFPDFDTLEFQEKRRNISWINNDVDFTKFQGAKTGYPIIDAAIMQLKTTNFMHGRTRMVTASFLSKNLLIDWKKGENFFSKYLLDYDETINIGNWQWSASVGPDPKPLRVFNPILQSEKFDENAEYSKKHIPELEKFSPKEIHNPMKYDLSSYCRPIVPQKESGKRAREWYKKG